jgi:hypothetical protein
MVQNLSALHLGRMGAGAIKAVPALTDLVKSKRGRDSILSPNGQDVMFWMLGRPALAAKNAIKRIEGASSN